MLINEEHDAMVKFYSQPENLFGECKECKVYREKRLCEIPGLKTKSKLKPDLVFICENAIYVVEVKVSFNPKTKEQADKQMSEYIQALSSEDKEVCPIAIYRDIISWY